MKLTPPNCHALTCASAMCAILTAMSAHAQTVTNGSFEADTFTVFPGYSSGNGNITDWTSTNTSRTGLNPSGGSPFANNGSIPDGSNVAFIQNASGATGTLSQTITGLTAGETYRISYSYNGRAGGADAQLQATVGGATLLQTPTTFTEVGGSNPYFYAGNEFTATGSTATLTFANINGSGDSTLLLDNISIASASSDGLTTAAWTGDADSGVSSSWNYTAAVNSGSGTNAAINGVTFTGGGAASNPSGTGYTTSGLINTFGNDSNSVRTAGGGSGTLATTFQYAGNPETITFTGLTVGRQYVADIYTVGFDVSSGNARYQTISDGAGGTVTINPNLYGNNEGMRLSYTYTATSTSQSFSFTPQAAGATFHNYGFSNRQNFLAWDDAGTSDWSTVSSWDAENNSTIPGAGVTAVIDNGGTAQVSSGTASAASLELGGASSGTLDYIAGTLDIASINMAANGTFQASNTTAQTVNSTITGSGAVVKNGAGTLNLTAQNTYTGSTTVSGGILSLTTGQIYSTNGWANRSITINSGGLVEVGGWADGDTLNSKAGLGQVNFVASNILVDNGTIRYTGSSTNGKSDRGFTIGAGGATLEAEGSNDFVLTHDRGYGIGSSAGGTLTLSGSQNGTFNHKLGGSGGLVKDGTGTWTVNNTNTYTGSTTVNDGTLILNAPSAYYGYGGGQININGGSLRIQNSYFFQNKSFVFGADGGGNIDIGAGNNVFRSNNSFTTLGGSQNTITQSSTFGLNSDGGGVRTFNIADGTDDVDLLVSAQITNNAAVAKTGAGTMTFSAANSYSGGTTVDGGTLILTDNGRIGGGALTVNNGGTFSVQNDDFNSAPGTITVNAGGTVSADSTGNNAHNVSAVTLNGGTLSSSGNAYSEGNWIFNGDVTVGGSALSTISGLSVGSKSGGGTYNVADSVAGSGTDLLVTAKMVDASGGSYLTKTGAGTMELTAANTYTGTTTVSEGTLSLASGYTHSGSGAYVVQGGTLKIADGVDISGHTMTISLGGVISPGNSPGTASTGSQTWNDGGAYLWEINNSGGTKGDDPGWDWLDITGTLDLTNLSAGGFTIDITSLTPGNVSGLAAGFDYSGLAYGDAYGTTFIIASADTISGFDASLFTLDDSAFVNGKLEWSISEIGTDLVLSAVFVPEPSSTALLGLGGLALALRRKRS